MNWSRKSYLGPCRMKFNCSGFSNMVTERALFCQKYCQQAHSIKIREKSPNTQHTIRPLHNLSHIGKTDFTYVHPSEMRVRFVNGTFPHWCYKPRNFKFFHQLVSLFDNTVPDGATVSQDDGIFGPVEELEHACYHLCFYLWIIFWHFEVQRFCKTFIYQLIQKPKKARPETSLGTMSVGIIKYTGLA